MTLRLKVQKTCSQSVMEPHTNWPKFKHPKNRREVHPLWTFTIPASPLALNRSSLRNLTQPHPETTEELTPPPICLYKYWAQWHSRSENKEVTLLPSHSTYPCTLEEQKEAPLLSECRRQRREVQETGQGWGGVLTAEMAQGGTHRLGKDTPLASNKITTPIFSTPGKAMPPAAKGNSLCFLLAPGSQSCCSSSTPQLQHRPGPCQHKPTQATLSVLVHAWKQLSSWFFSILNEQNKIKVFKYFDHVGKKQYFKRQKCIYSSIFNYNAQHSANINLWSEYISDTIASMVIVPHHSLTFFLILHGPQHLWYLRQQRPAGLLKLDSRKNRSSKIECSPGIVYRSDQSNKPLLLWSKGKAPNPWSTQR